MTPVTRKDILNEPANAQCAQGVRPAASPSSLEELCFLCCAKTAELHPVMDLPHDGI